MRRMKKTNWGIRNELGPNVPDSGQEHFTHGDDGFLVATTSLDAVIAFTKFRMLPGTDERIGNLN